MRVVSKRQRRHHRREGLKRGGRFLLRRVLPLSLVAIVLAQLWPRVHAWISTSPSFQVDRVLVSGNMFLTPREIVSIAGIEPGAPLISLRPEEAEGRLRLHPRVRRAAISYVFPRAIRLWVEERQPIALIESDGLHAVSRDGVVLPPVEGRPIESLPLLLPPPGVTTEGHLVKAPPLLEALTFLAELEHVDVRLSRTVSLVDLSDARFARVYVDSLDTALIYEVGGEWNAHVRALPAVMEDLTRTGVEGAVLDLRFREQIVRRGGALAQAMVP